MNIFRLAVTVVANAVLGVGASSSAWEMNTYQDFIRGEFKNMALGRDGRLMLSPRIDSIFDSGEQAVWAMAKAPDGSTYVATGHRGKLYKVSPNGSKILVWSSSQPEIFALAVDAKGVVYAGTSPDGKIHRIENGIATEYYETKTKFVWSLIVTDSGVLFAGTSQGNVHRITAAQQGEIYYATGQAHVTAMALDRQGRLLAGTEPNGILYRIEAKDKAFVLFDANLPEIRTILPAADDSVYVAALGGSLAGRGVQTGTPTSVNPVTMQGTTITVTENAAASIPTVDLPKPEANQRTASPAPAAPTQPLVTTTVEMTGVEKSALYRIHPDNTVETLWSSKEENIYAVARVGDYLLLGTDSRGRIYRLSQDRKVTLLAETGESAVTRLSLEASDVLAATSDQGKLLRIGRGFNDTGSFEAPVHDSTSVARWGRFDWRVDLCANCKVKFETRSGNSSRPDRTWSDWTEVSGNQNKSPNSRYLQWRVTLTGSQGMSPVLESVSASYLPQNMAPSVRSISLVLFSPSSGSKAQPSQTQTQTPSFSVTVTDTADPQPATSAGTPSQILTRGGAQSLQLSWQADDPDGDKLIYAAYFRGEGEQEWKLLKANLPDNSLVVDSDALADGRYVFRVIASDRLMNPGQASRQSELISNPFLIDNTPPLVTMGTPVKADQTVTIPVTAVDAISPIRRAEYSLDAGPWTPLDALDGILDSLTERIEVRLESLPMGEHLVSVRVYDSAGNAGLAKTVLR